MLLGKMVIEKVPSINSLTQTSGFLNVDRLRLNRCSMVKVMSAEALYKSYLSARRGIARAVSKIVPPHEIEDIVQETYVRLCQIATADNIDQPKSFLYKIARNLALDSVKKANNRLTESWDHIEEDRYYSSTSDAVLDQVISNEEFGRFCEAVRRLPRRRVGCSYLRKCMAIRKERLLVTLVYQRAQWKNT